jgi:SM-20-related protein
MILSEFDIETLGCPRSNSSCVVIKDNLFDDIITSLYEEVNVLKQFLRPAKMNRGDQTWGNEDIRGDSLCWITPELCQEKGLTNLQLFLSRILTECALCFEEILRLKNDYNFQFALYPGKGEGYHRHRDAFPTTASSTSVSRQLTCILYLNRDWETSDGGQLRVFTNPGVTINGGDDAFDFWGLHGCDIYPTFGRLVIFRSALVEHAVLPCFYERMALTLWINGEGPEEGILEAQIEAARAPPLPKEYFDKYKYVGEDIDEKDSHDDEVKSETEA